MKRPNLRMIVIKEGEESQVKGTENIFNKTIEANFPNPKKEKPNKVQEAYRATKRLVKKRKSPGQ